MHNKNNKDDDDLAITIAQLFLLSRQAKNGEVKTIVIPNPLFKDVYTYVFGIISTAAGFFSVISATF